MDFSFFIVDDRELDCYIAEKIIEKTQRSYERKSFHEANACLDHIKSREVSNNITVILLDIMMPIMNGFEFLDAFEALSEDMKSQYRVVPITTSLNKNDIHRIENYPSVIKVLQKPYTIEDIIKTLDSIQSKQNC